MKSLLLFAALSLPAMAKSPIKFFGDWEVLSDGLHLTATSVPIKISKHALFLTCDINHQNCSFTYTDTKQCNTTNERYLIISALADGVSVGFPTSCINGQWTEKPWDWIDFQSILYHSRKYFSVYFPDETNSTNIYNKSGATEAIKYVLGIQNNFNQE
ncbi:hypothetical protein D5018_19535 [Parashewanella curva]|uniref:Uncharacterized protein n=1 Tax=Parashewanella curva TaxID=2338552 RepID=A0A3L8PRK5_9GAMM|nr:hypothetical protein [Parashewanella curva]RLV58015.1 hypothetical protein D5018_19535 [Parashewanella curva]